MTGSGADADPVLSRGGALTRRPSAERFHTRRDWLDSRHSFSFAGHDHPDWRGFGPLLVINEDHIAPGGGFGMHPHADMEIITVMLSGCLRHRDSLGHSERLLAGEVQRMTAGSGIVHSEINDGAEPCHLLQIWIQPVHAGLPPDYEQKAMPPGHEWTALIDPQRQAGALAIDRPLRLWRVQPPAGAVLPLPGELATARQGWLQLIAGDLQLDLPDGPDEGSVPLAAGDGLGLEQPRGGQLRAGPAGADLLLFAWS
ncbi:MAG: pirin family protein [Synechococcaceae cyanobacterium]|nr:pirin family protein [Synechococcaceae cyanobacterium]